MTKRLILTLAASLLLAAMLIGAPNTTTAPTTAPTTTKAPPAVAADQPNPRGDKMGTPSASWMTRHDTYVALAKKGGVDLYFLGDSITDGWHGGGQRVWAKEFAAWKPENFGIGGDQTQHVLWRLKNGELDGVSPKVFVMMIGTNNLGGYNNEQIAAANAAIVKELQTKYPQAKILLLGIFPRWNNKETKGLQPRIKEVNALLAKLDDGKNVKYLDIGDKFLVDGKLTADIMPDGLHPNEKGYQIWADAIKPVLTEWLGAPKQNP